MALFCLVGLGSLSTCSPAPSQLERIKKRGALKVVTLNSPTTYFEAADGPTGFEYDLASGLADQLGVRLEIKAADHLDDVLAAVANGQADVAAAGLGITAERETQVRFTSPVRTVVPELVYAMQRGRPRDLGDLQGTLRVSANSAPAARLAELRASRFPNLVWQESPRQNTEDLIQDVLAGRIAHTVVNSDLAAMQKRYYPRLMVADPIATPQPLAWALARSPDDSLWNAVEDYLAQMRGGELARISDRYFGHIEEDYSSIVALGEHLRSRLPPLRGHFERAGERTGLDWVLLAAIGYQESHWNAQAVSPTGVRGVMMLTKATAAFLKVADREDAAQSIEGGSRYFRLTLEKIPAEVPEPDRLWMALAAYNQGLGHLLDARQLTQKLGGDPNRWLDVRNTLPLLTQPRWHSQTRYGYARGYEAVSYVRGVRSTYDTLRWHLSGGTLPAPSDTEPELALPAEAEAEKNPLNIDTPAF